jgi:hypothetical protein
VRVAEVEDQDITTRDPSVAVADASVEATCEPPFSSCSKSKTETATKSSRN